jgi:hypothetical protein
MPPHMWLCFNVPRATLYSMAHQKCQGRLWCCWQLCTAVADVPGSAHATSCMWLSALLYCSLLLWLGITGRGLYLCAASSRSCGNLSCCSTSASARTRLPDPIGRQGNPRMWAWWCTCPGWCSCLGLSAGAMRSLATQIAAAAQHTRTKVCFCVFEACLCMMAAHTGPRPSLRGQDRLGGVTEDARNSTQLLFSCCMYYCSLHQHLLLRCPPACHRGVAHSVFACSSLSSYIIASVNSTIYVNVMALLIHARMLSKGLATLQSQHPIAPCAAWPEDGREGSVITVAHF